MLGTLSEHAAQSTQSTISHRALLVSGKKQRLQVVQNLHNIAAYYITN